MDTVSERIAAELRSQRARADITQQELADAVGAAPSTVGAWESRGGIGLKDAWRLADFYGVTLDELAGRDALPAPCGADKDEVQG